jgi:hypothetical protein
MQKKYFNLGLISFFAQSEQSGIFYIRVKTGNRIKNLIERNLIVNLRQKMKFWNHLVNPIKEIYLALKKF